MPFKWRLKKARKYDLSTKNLFIVGVYQLDNSYLECTLNAESTGQECLNSIAQRIELSENHYFGLRYVTKKLHFHWVDLEKPLKKQLDKYAQPANHCHCLYFGVMFYVLGAHKISDEVARYHYYLQLKNDIIDGRLPCSAEQAIRLAAYSLQALTYLCLHEKRLSILEIFAILDSLIQTMMKDEAITAELFSEAVSGHASLQGVPPIRAGLQYVKEVQVMDGYGAEYYSAKDESRKDLYLGTSYAGMFARYIDGQSTVYYKWTEIAKVTQNKKTLEIDTAKSSVQFQLEDSDTAKYVSRLAQLQCKFYKSSKGNLSHSLTDVSLGEENEGAPYIDAQQVYIPPTDYSSHSSQELAHSQTSLTHLQDQRHYQDPAHGSHQSSLQSLESSSETKQQSYHLQQTQFTTAGRPLPASTPSLSSSSQQHHYQHPQHHTVGIVDSEEHQHHLHHTGNGVFTQQGMRYENLTPTPEGDPVYVNRAALLPAYRPSPDYDVVMQQRMMMQQQQQQQQHANQSPQHLHQHQQHHHLQPHFEEIATSHLGPAQVYVHPDGMAYSQPEISHNSHSYRSNSFSIGNTNSHSHNDEHGNYANVDALKNYSIYANIFQDLPHHGHYQGGRSGSVSGPGGGAGGVGMMGLGGSLAVHPTYSSPDLHTGGEALITNHADPFTTASSLVPGNLLSAQEAALAYHQYRPPPPPYPRTSSSTPDLAVGMSSIPAPIIPTFSAQTSVEQQSERQQQQSDNNIHEQPHHNNNNNNDSSVLHAQLGHNLDDISVLQVLQNANPHIATETDAPSLNPTLPDKNGDIPQGKEKSQLVSDIARQEEEIVIGVERKASDASTHNSSARSSLRGNNELPHVKETAGRVLSDDPDDTSSEHSYSTFHAKESDESSDDENTRLKPVAAAQQSEEPKIQIRMFSPDEAPPMSKIKEEATLRESFRRMKIARSGSLNKEGPMLKQSSMRGLKDLGGALPYHNPAPLNVVNEQPQDSPVVALAEPALEPKSSHDNEVTQVPEMEEILDRLGDPPPYPGSQLSQDPYPQILDKQNEDFYPPVGGLDNDNFEQKETDEPKPSLAESIRSSSDAEDPSLIKVTVKRSSSTGNPSPSSNEVPALPPPRRIPIIQKQRAATVDLDTVVPLSKPGMVRFVKEGCVPDMGTSVLKSEVTRTSSVTVTDSDSGSSKCLSEQDKDDSSSDNLASLHDYSMGSDSDSDHERSLSEGLHVGPLKMAAMNGLTLSRSVVLSLMNDESRAPTDDRRRMLESKISEGQVYAEFEKIPRKSSSLECTVAKASHNAARNRFKDVLPYDATRVKLTPHKDNPDGYINASNIK
ncbi:tyrosine-protein phosphatase non-receptor type, partial [Plakobranchus ocellatus]